MLDYATAPLTQVTKEPGLADLPLQVRAKFAQALRLEAQGDHAGAEVKLNEAIAIEQGTA